MDLAYPAMDPWNRRHDPLSRTHSTQPYSQRINLLKFDMLAYSTLGNHERDAANVDLI